MLNLLTIFRANWRIFAYVGIALFLILTGWQAHKIVVRAELAKEYKQAIESRDKEIIRLANEVGLQSEAARLIAVERAELKEKNNQLSEEIEATYYETPAITTTCIAAQRVKLLNSQRDSANRIGGAR